MLSCLGDNHRLDVSRLCVDWRRDVVGTHGRFVLSRNVFRVRGEFPNRNRIEIRKREIINLLASWLDHLFF